jgi:hypothetical protein
MPRLGRVLFGFAATAAVVSAGAHLRAQDKWIADVKQRIVTASKGWDFAPALHTGSLNEGATATVGFFLEAKTSYRIVGRCDPDCADLDLRLIDPGGREIEKDIDDDDIPEVNVTPREDGEYTVRVVMADCKTKPCFFAVGALIRDEAAGR